MEQRHHHPSRRTFLAGGITGLNAIAAGGQTPATAPSYAEQFPDMLLANLAGKLNAHAATWDRIRDAIATPAAVEERNRFVRLNSRRCCTDIPRGRSSTR
jgi:hypothetical protein